MNELIDTCRTIVADLRMKAQAGGKLTASEKMILRQLIWALKKLPMLAEPGSAD